jgi:hypothetical protein
MADYHLSPSAEKAKTGFLQDSDKKLTGNG